VRLLPFNWPSSSIESVSPPAGMVRVIPLAMNTPLIPAGLEIVL
jgi:hypothetical protein